MTTARSTHSIVSTPRQADFLAIPETPFVYWLRQRFFELLSLKPTVGEKYRITWGVSSSDNDRFLRLFWETDGSREYWLKHAKGSVVGAVWSHGSWIGETTAAL